MGFQRRRATAAVFASVLTICCLGFAARAHAQHFLGDKTHSAFQAYSRYLFHNPHFAPELAYVDLGKLEYAGDFEGTPISGALKIGGVNLAARASVRLASSWLFAKAGVLAWSAEASALPGIVSPGVKRGQDFSYGLGARLDLSRKWSVRAEWEHFKLDAAEARLVTLGAAYRF